MPISLDALLFLSKKQNPELDEVGHLTWALKDLAYDSEIDGVLTPLQKGWIDMQLRLAEEYQKIAEAAVAQNAFMVSHIYKLTQFNDFLIQSASQFDQFSSEYSANIAEASKRLAEMSTVHSDKILQLALGKQPDLENFAMQFSLLRSDAVNAILGRRPTLSQHSVYLKNLAAQHGANAMSQSVFEMAYGVGVGRNPKRIARRMSQKFDQAYYKMATVARSEMIQSYRSTQREMYRRSGVVEGYIRIAAHDKRTCPVCLSLDGHFYTLDEEMPVHANDRCGQAPSVQGKELDLGIDGEQWLMLQDKETQDAILGKKAGQALRNGEIKLSDFVSEYHHPVWGPSVRTKPYYQMAGLPSPASDTPQRGGGRVYDDDWDGEYAGFPISGDERAEFQRGSTAWVNLSDAEREDAKMMGYAYDSYRKNKIVTELSQRTGLDYFEVNDLIHSWASTSNDSDMRALFLQENASKVFGTELSKWQKSKIEILMRRRLINEDTFEKARWHEDDLEFIYAQWRGMVDPAHYPLGFADAFGSIAKQTDFQSFEEFRELLATVEEQVLQKQQAFLKAMYDYSQEEFEKDGLDYILVYRGTKPGTITGAEIGDIINLTENTMSSWSTDYTVARGFATSQGTVTEMLVPTKRMVGSARTGFGCLDEAELVMIGGQGVEDAATVVFSNGQTLSLGSGAAKLIQEEWVESMLGAGKTANQIIIEFEAEFKTGVPQDLWELIQEETD